MVINWYLAAKNIDILLKRNFKVVIFKPIHSLLRQRDVLRCHLGMESSPYYKEIIFVAYNMYLPNAEDVFLL